MIILVSVAGGDIGRMRIYRDYMLAITGAG